MDIWYIQIVIAWQVLLDFHDCYCFECTATDHAQRILFVTTI